MPDKGWWGHPALLHRNTVGMRKLLNPKPYFTNLANRGFAQSIMITMKHLYIPLRDNNSDYEIAIVDPDLQIPSASSDVTPWNFVQVEKYRGSIVVYLKV